MLQEVLIVDKPPATSFEDSGRATRNLSTGAILARSASEGMGFARTPPRLRVLKLRSMARKTISPVVYGGVGRKFEGRGGAPFLRGFSLEGRSE